MREGRPLPRRMANAPDLHLGLSLYFEAFIDLNSCRMIGMEISPIPWSMIKDYAIAYELDEDQTEQLFYFVREMDDAYMKWSRSKSRKK